jgi:hypothetical protein
MMNVSRIVMMPGVFIYLFYGIEQNILIVMMWVAGSGLHIHEAHQYFTRKFGQKYMCRTLSNYG